MVLHTPEGKVDGIDPPEQEWAYSQQPGFVGKSYKARFTYKERTKVPGDLLREAPPPTKNGEQKSSATRFGIGRTTL